MSFKEEFRDRVAKLVYPYPDLYLLAQALYYRRNLINGKRLINYARQKSTWEKFRDIGPGENQIQVETLYTSINTGTELAYYQRLPNTNAGFPYCPVGSGVGRVTKLGRGVRGVKRGDLVTGSFYHSSVNVCQVNKNLVKISSEIDLESAALFHLAIIAMQSIRMGMIREHANARIVVMGQGVIGRLATVIARAMGNEVTCVTLTPEKLIRLGEKQGFAYSNTHGKNVINKIQADVVIDSTGDPDAIHSAIRMVKDGGRVVLLGSNRGSTSAFDFNSLLLEKSLSIVGAHIQNQPAMPNEIGLGYQGETAFIQELIQTGKLSLADVITHRLDWSELADFYQNDLPHLRGSCGIIVDWTNQNCDIDVSIDPLPRTIHKDESYKPLKMALVGCGRIGQTNAVAIDKSTSFELVLAMDSQISHAEEIGKKFQIPFTNKLEEVVRNPEIDAVLIGVPHFLHASLTKQVAAAGKHVLVEKPLAICLEEAYEMIDEARNHNVLLRTFLAFRFDEPKLIAKTLIEHDAVGNIFGVVIENYQYRHTNYWYEGTRGRFEKNWRGIEELSGGGVVMMNLIHAIDYLCYITSMEITSVFAQSTNLWHPVEVEDTVGITFQGAKGEMGTITSANNVRGSRGDLRGKGGDMLRVWGENGQVILDGDVVHFYSLRPMGQYRAQQWHTIKPKINRDFRARYLNSFRRQIEEGQSTDFDNSGASSLAFVMAVYRSADLGVPVSLEEVMDRKFSNEKLKHAMVYV